MTLRSAILTLASAALLAGCAVSPGLSVDVNTKKGERYVRDDLEAIPITPEVIAQLRAERPTGAPPPAAFPATGNAAIAGYRYVLGPQDVLRITVWGHPDFGGVAPGGIGSTPNQNNDRVIQQDGKLFFPLAGKVPAAGLTVPQLRDNLAQALRPFLREPQVEVEVAQYRSQRVFVAGEVKTPGNVPVTGVPLRLTDALGQVGGATPVGDLGRVRVTRGEASWNVDLDRLYYEGDLGANLLLQHGDVITVPDRGERKLYVLGEVNAPRSYPMRRGEITLAEALADAGGPNPNSSSARQIYVLRLAENKEPMVYHLDGRRPEALLLADQMPLRPRDLVYVNPTAITRVSRLVNQFFPVLSGSAIINSISN